MPGTHKFELLNFKIDLEIPGQVFQLWKSNGGMETIVLPLAFDIGSIYITDAEQTIAELILPLRYGSIYLMSNKGVFKIDSDESISISGWAGDEFIHHQIVAHWKHESRRDDVF